MDDNLELDFDDYLDEIGETSFTDAMVTGTDWTTETIIRQVIKGNIILAPNFQRRDAWTPQRKSLFIESIFMGFPIPQLVLAEIPGSKGKFIVLDGKQRLLSILQFAAFEARDVFPALKLKSLPILKELENKTYEMLNEEGYDFSQFENHWIRTTVIKNCPSNEFLYQIFYRLNSGSLPLSPQELRFALSPSEFSEFLDVNSSKMNVFRDVFNTDKPDFRMRDAELLLRHLANMHRLPEYRGNLKKYLDDSFLEFTQNFTQLISVLVEDVNNLEASHQFIKAAFNSDAYRKWNGVKFEGRFNRAIFEVFSYIFSNESNRKSVDGAELVKLYKELTETNREYAASFETTTKSIQAVEMRFNTTITGINQRFGLNIDTFELRA